MATYNWQQKDWPLFSFSLDGLEDDLLLFAEKTGRISGIVDSLPQEMTEQAILEIMVAEAINTSQIEGEYFERKDVLSSIRKNLGLHYDAEDVRNKSAAGVGELMSDVRKSYNELLSSAKLFSWHSMLFPDNRNMVVGAWRTHVEPMQVISGVMGKEKVHFEAPPSGQVAAEMEAFITWFNETAPGGKNEIKKAPVRAAIAHLYFESIHPFEDGNGRIGRAIAEKAISQTLGRPALLSLSTAIESRKKDYYQALEKAQQSNEISEWMAYFIRTLLIAQTDTAAQIEFTLKKTRFFHLYNNQLNSRQLAVVKRMLQNGYHGFEGGMNTRKYVAITKTSKATATRDLQFLTTIGAFIPAGNSGGRSTRYQLNI
jgi:Fic family protein